MEFRISEKILEEFPNVEEYVVIARGLNNEIPGKKIFDDLSKEAAKVRAAGDSLLDKPRYSKWVHVYERIAKNAGLSEQNMLPSHVALVKRILDGKDLPNINPLVNCYNFFSVRYGVPIGGEDLSAVYGDMELLFTDGTEKYLELGSDKVEVLNPGEIAWKDEHSVTCRMWAWRQSERTKVTKNTTDGYFIFDTFKDLQDVNLSMVTDEFARSLEREFGGEVSIYLLDKDNASVEIEYESEALGGLDIEKDLKKYIVSKEKSKAKKQDFMKRKPKPMNLADEKTMLGGLSKSVTECLDPELTEIDLGLTVSNDEKFGDVSSTVPMRLSAKNGKDPREIAQVLVSKLRMCDRIGEVFEEVTVAGKGFLNFGLSREYLVSQLESSLSEGDDYASMEVGEHRVILVESPSINPNKAAHVGHLLNLFIGRSLSRLFEKVGFESPNDNLINDKGLPICQTIWALRKYAASKTPESEGMKPDHFVSEYYILGKNAYEQDDSVKEEVRDILQRFEQGDEEILSLWRQMIEWAFKGQEETFARLDEERGHLWFESEVYTGGRDIIMEHLGDGVVEELPDGAIVGRLEEEYGVPDVVLIRSDGTSLYHTQDVNLTLKKIEKFDPWKAIWVVGDEQITHFQRLFALLDAMGIISVDNLYHFAYARVVDKDGKVIKSRDGSEISADGMLDMMQDAALEVINSRKIKADLESKRDVADAVGSGALRYAFLSRDPFKKISFDVNEAVSFTGRSGPYVMYSYARGKSVLRKALGKDVNGYGVSSELKMEPSKIDISQEARRLLVKVLLYPDVVLSAAGNYAPNMIAEYLYEVASLFNNFYEKHTISGAEGEQRTFRLALTKLTTVVLRDGMKILGLPVLEKM